MTTWKVPSVALGTAAATVAAFALLACNGDPDSGSNPADAGGVGGADAGGTDAAVDPPNCGAGPTGVWQMHYGDTPLECDVPQVCSSDCPPRDQDISVWVGPTGALVANVSDSVTLEGCSTIRTPNWPEVTMTWEASSCTLTVETLSLYCHAAENQGYRSTLQVVLDGDSAAGRITYGEAWCNETTRPDYSVTGKRLAEKSCDPTGSWSVAYSGGKDGCAGAGGTGGAACAPECNPVSDSIELSFDSNGELVANTGRTTPTDTCGGTGSRRLQTHFDPVACTVSVYEEARWCDVVDKCDVRLLSFDASGASAKGVLGFQRCECPVDPYPRTFEAVLTR